MTKQMELGGSFTLPGTSLDLKRMGYGAMQLAGPQVWGPPRDIDAAIAVLRQALAAGVNHIDTSDYYGPHVTNQIIKQALHPYERGLVIVTKLGARRLADKSWVHALSREELIDGVHDNLRNLGLDALDVVNLRVGSVLAPAEGSIEEPLTVLAELQRQGLIRHLGLSNVTRAQLAEAQGIAEIVCVQNLYNVALRQDDGFIDELAASRHRLCAVLPAGRVYSAAIFGTGPDGCRTWGDADADRAVLATAALAQYSADPRDVVRQTSSRESGSGEAADSWRDSVGIRFDWRRRELEASKLRVQRRDAENAEEDNAATFLNIFIYRCQISTEISHVFGRGA